MDKKSGICKDVKCNNCIIFKKRISQQKKCKVIKEKDNLDKEVKTYLCPQIFTDLDINNN